MDIVTCGRSEHTFEPRYDEIEELDHIARDKAIKFYQEDSASPMLDDCFLKKKVYILDICTKCGMTVFRKTN